MNQQIVVSTEIVSYLESKLPAYRKNDAIELIEYIEQNYFVSDSAIIHFNKIIDKIDQLDPTYKKEELKKIINYWIQEKKLFVECNYENLDEEEITLTEHTLDKIYVQPMLHNKEVAKFAKRFNELEIHNSESFIFPKPYHKLKHLPSLIPLEKELFYDIVRIVGPFIRNSDNVRIEDPYLPNPLASYNVVKIIKNFPGVNFDLVFLTRDLFSEHKLYKEKEKKLKQYDSFIESLSELNEKGYKINFNNNYKLKKHRERFIFTEDFQIYIPGGFDFINKDGYIVANDFDISDKKEIRIEERKFQINN